MASCDSVLRSSHLLSPDLCYLSFDMDIAVVDYGMGNLRSVAKALLHVAPDASIVVSSRPEEIRAAARVVLPGQSAMPDTIASLDATGLRGVVLDCLADRPFLGVCLGLQMLFDSSEEGPTACLGVLAGSVQKFRDEHMALPSGDRLKVPHMGWSPVRQVRAHPLWSGIDDGARFYFAHSYYPVPADRGVTAGTASYPSAFTCAIARANIFAVQFHPEKSHRAGLKLLANFVAWDGNS
jgi:imidazole glycerol-phosphate synthase subunit HisH